MHSIRTKFTLLTVGAIIIAISIAMFLCVFSIKDLGRSDSDQLLHLVCETGAMNLESYFESVEQSVRTVTTLVQNSLEEVPLSQLGFQVERARNLFGQVAYHTNGVLTYYFRIDPEISSVPGFWYVNLDGKGFQEHEVTDISAYDTNDTSKLVWFTVPKATGEGVWLPPYYTDNLDVLVISYNMPVYWEEEFIGVIGIEIDYRTLSHEVENIKLYESGYAFILDEDMNIIYHPKELGKGAQGENQAVFSPLRQFGDYHIEYRFEGMIKEAVWHQLSNGMRLYVTVPLYEINKGWKNLVGKILLASLILIAVVSLVTMRFAERITAPLRQLTQAAKQADEGNYEFPLEYDKKDEVGILTHTFKILAAHTREHINTLSREAYIDPLTSVGNKRAYGDVLQDIQDQIEEGKERAEFAIGVFDCDNLKWVNDTYGHDKGDFYLRTASQLISQIFQAESTYRIGGDEFAVILTGRAYQEREALVSRFRSAREKVCEGAKEPWEKVNVTMGLAVYEAERDMMAIDVARRADQMMYENKRLRKRENG